MAASQPNLESEPPRQPGDGEDITATEARQAVPTGRVRWILLISVLLAVIALGGAFIWYEVAHHAAASQTP